MKTARLDMDRPIVGRSVTVALGLLAVIAFAAGYGSLAEVARWAGLSPWSAWTIPAVIDLGMVVLGMSAMVQRSRREPARLMWSATGVLVSISIAAQVAHSVTTSVTTGWVLVVAVLVACTPPATTLVAAEAALRLVVATPVRRASRQRPTTAVGPVHTVVDQPVQPSAHEPVAVAHEPVHEPAQPEEMVRSTPDAGPTPTTSGLDRTAVVAQARELITTGMTTRQVAEQVGVSRSTLGRWLAADKADELAA